MARGSIRKRGTNRWQLTYDVPRGPDGKRRQRYETVRGTKKQAQARLTEIEHSLNNGRYFEPSLTPFGDYLDLWLQESSRNHRPKTAEHHEGIVRRHVKPSLGTIPMARLTAMDIQSLYNEKLDSGLSTQTVIHIHRTIRQALRQAVSWELLQRNVTDQVTPPRNRRPKLRCLTVDEIRKLLLTAHGSDYHLPVHLAIYTGLRRSEILGLRWLDIDLSARRLTVNQTIVVSRGQIYVSEPKTERSRRVLALDTDTIILLEEHRERGDGSGGYVCVRSNGSAIMPGALTKGYKRLAKRCGIVDVRFHDLRHTHATMLLEAGVPVHVVQARMGHESIQTTVDTYGHVLPTSDSAAAAALREKLA